MMLPRHNRPDQTGFTLLEVIIALAILLIGVVFILQLFPQSLNAMRIAGERTTAAQLAQSSLGQLRASTGEAVYRDELPPGLLSFNAIEATYRYYTTVQRMRGAAEIYLQRVTFTVSFPDGREETFVTYLAKP